MTSSTRAASNTLYIVDCEIKLIILYSCKTNQLISQSVILKHDVIKCNYISKRKPTAILF